jgi:hypothetical protein
MSAIPQSISQKELEKRWQERCRQGNFSRAVLGVGTIRIFGKSGDAPVTFPRVETLAALDQLEADERWALDIAQDVVAAAQVKHRSVMATQPPQNGVAPSPRPLINFDPKTENILILSLTRGG